MTIFKKLIYVSTILIFMMVLPAFADKSSVEINAPGEVKKGETIIIILKVTHDGNNFLHYTDWVYIKAGNIEIARWDYSMFDTPESEVFTKEVEYTVNEPVTIEAEANCNIHGNAGKKTLNITVKDN